MQREVRKVNFTKVIIAGLQAPEGTGKAILYHDANKAHLTIKVTSAGKRIFYLYRKVKGRPLKIKIGEFPDTTIEQARKRAEKLNGQIADGLDPSIERVEEKRESTLGVLYEKYLKEHLETRGKGTKNAKSYFKNHLSKWRNRGLSAIKSTEVQLLHSKIAAKTSGPNANRACEFLRAMYGRAKYWGLFEGDNPAENLDWFPETQRKRFLQGDELPRFFKALADEKNETIRDYFLISLLTGQRRSNVQAMRWGQVNFQMATWIIPAAETKASRAGRVQEDHNVPLTPEAMAILSQRRESSKGEWVFPSSRSRTGHIVEPKSAWTRILKRAEIPIGMRGNGVTIHDLRRTLGSWQAAQGDSLSIIGAGLGHRNASTTAIYARLTLDPIRTSINSATKAMFEAGGILESGDVVNI